MSASEVEERAKRLPRRGWVTIPEVAAARGVSRVAILYSIRSGKLRAYRASNGRTWLIHAEDARAFLELPVRGRAVAA